MPRRNATEREDEATVRERDMHRATEEIGNNIYYYLKLNACFIYYNGIHFIESLGLFTIVVIGYSVMKAFLIYFFNNNSFIFGEAYKVSGSFLLTGARAIAIFVFLAYMAIGLLAILALAVSKVYSYGDIKEKVRLPRINSYIPREQRRGRRRRGEEGDEPVSRRSTLSAFQNKKVILMLFFGLLKGFIALSIVTHIFPVITYFYSHGYTGEYNLLLIAGLIIVSYLLMLLLLKKTWDKAIGKVNTLSESKVKKYLSITVTIVIITTAIGMGLVAGVSLIETLHTYLYGTPASITHMIQVIIKGLLVPNQDIFQTVPTKLIT
ncbi:hypothetical protein NEOKW01_0287 [Nematocida sp. AWRm80]|nr:hypothetical protein NEOKW01_0287 [Nematocida sp. AWRm80]